MHLPLKPYFENAYDWWKTNVRGTDEEYAAWLIEQGRVAEISDPVNYRQIPFQSEEQLLIFKLRWS